MFLLKNIASLIAVSMNSSTSINHGLQIFHETQIVIWLMSAFLKFRRNAIFTMFYQLSKTSIGITH